MSKISQKTLQCILPLVTLITITACKIQHPPSTQEIKSEISHQPTPQMNDGIFYTGIVLTGTAFGVGSTFGILSLKKSNDVDDYLAKIKKKENPFICLPEWNDPDCKAGIKAYDDSVIFEQISWIGFGIATSTGIATLIYYVNSPSNEKNKTISFEAVDGGGIVTYNVSY